MTPSLPPNDKAHFRLTMDPVGHFYGVLCQPGQPDMSFRSANFHEVCQWGMTLLKSDWAARHEAAGRPYVPQATPGDAGDYNEERKPGSYAN